MENANDFLLMLNEHWQTLGLLGSFIVGGGYLINRYRTSGMRKLLNAHSELLDDLSNRLSGLRLEREAAREELAREKEKFREELSQERNEHRAAKDRVKFLEDKLKSLDKRVLEMENRERELLLQINLKR